jgi:hypothetical protein
MTMREAQVVMLSLGARQLVITNPVRKGHCGLAIATEARRRNLTKDGQTGEQIQKRVT